MGAVQMSEEVSWLNHAVGAALATMGAFALMVGGAIARLWRHEERIKALEGTQASRSAALDALAEKVDSHHAATTDRIDAMGEGIRADLRLIISRCLTIDHGRHE